ncbi:MAG: 50S ribosomal protein L18e [Candidatus Bathyarchaeota archaeon]|nr:50S ribosomal protein L18e [Candidatus Bathyarchaeota archaeon]
MSPRRKIRSTNPDLESLIRLLKKKSRENEAAIWRDAAEKLSRPNRMRTAVNVSRICRYTEENEEVIVPGKVLGAGLIGHSVKVAALDFSDQARSKILQAKGKCLTIPELVEMNPKGANIKMIG